MVAPSNFRYRGGEEALTPFMLHIRFDKELFEFSCVDLFARRKRRPKRSPGRVMKETGCSEKTGDGRERGGIAAR
jgi:hypothetical protein